MTTPHDLDDRFREALGALGEPARRRDLAEWLPDGGPLTGAQALALFDAQLTSRLLDLAGRWLRGFGEGYYTIGSAGHESNAAVAAALRPTDPALLHYRSGAFYCVRAVQAAGDFPAAPPGGRPAGGDGSDDDSGPGAHESGGVGSDAADRLPPAPATGPSPVAGLSSAAGPSPVVDPAAGPSSAADPAAGGVEEAAAEVGLEPGGRPSTPWPPDRAGARTARWRLPS
ncbi:thiamine pyrophosphate-dependent enzyme [Micromonospora viridifaciens]|uniref:hypothetical protein n=1 Tax=Micromonospora viridifaciens TaxID=1881 RepID=UPI001E62DD52|nr:hypothetical protein [Micromonospora viridifaciens]